MHVSRFVSHSIRSLAAKFTASRLPGCSAVQLTSGLAQTSLEMHVTRAASSLLAAQVVFGVLDSPLGSRGAGGCGGGCVILGS